MDLIQRKFYLSSQRDSREEIVAQFKEWDSDKDCEKFDPPSDIANLSRNDLHFTQTVLRALRSCAFEGAYCNDHATLALVEVQADGEVNILVFDEW